LFLQRQPCIRTLKYAVGLRGAYPEIALGFAYQGRTLSEWYGSGDSLFDGWWPLPAKDPASALAAAIAKFRPTVIHSHNLPDSLTVRALEVTDGRIPVIHDSHDLQSLRRTPYEDGFDDPDDADTDTLEKAAIEGCAALVAVSQEMLDAIVVRHRPPERTLLFANYALARDVTRVPRRGRRDGKPLRVVYQGSLSANGSHYDLRDGFAALTAAGMLLDVFPNRDAPAYRELAARAPEMRLMETLEPQALLRRLPVYDVGWAVFNRQLNAAHLDTALPNKAFEYLASGVPIATGPHAALRRLITEHGVGVVIEDLAELPGVLADAPLPEMRSRAREMRSRFTVEGRIDELVALYSEVSRSPSARDPKRPSSLSGRSKIGRTLDRIQIDPPNPGPIPPVPDDSRTRTDEGRRAAAMKRFSTELWEALRPSLMPDPRRHGWSERYLLEACEAGVARLAVDPRSGPMAARSLFNSARSLMRAQDQLRAARIIELHLGRARELFEAERADLEPEGATPRCAALNRKGKPCGRGPIWGTAYCVSHSTRVEPTASPQPTL